MVFKRTDALSVIADGLAWIKMSCELRGLLKLFDNNVVAQRFFCQLLNATLDLALKVMDDIRTNYPAIDLGDSTKRIAYQITTEKRSNKVQNTLDTFVQHGLNQHYDTLKILVIGDRQVTYEAVEVPHELKFDCDTDILDIQGLLKQIDLLDTAHLEKLQAIFEQEMKYKSTCVLAAQGSQLAGLTVDIGADRDGFANVRTEESYPPERMLRYTCMKEVAGGQERLVIKPDMGYLSTLESGAPVEAIKFFHNPFLCQFPNLDVTFVNNTGETLAVTGAIFEVAESVPDMRPLILFKDDNARMILAIRNEGWGTVRNAVLKCNILPTSAEEIRPDPPIRHVSVAGPYAHEFAIGDFDDYYELNLEPTVTGLGVDIPAIKAAGFRSQNQYVLHAMQNGLDREVWQHFGRFPNLETNDTWKAFPDGYAVVAGVLEYDEDSGGGVTTRRSLPFRVRVFLFRIKYSLPMPPSYQYNLSLEPEGKKYEVFCPVSQSLKVGEADRIRIYIACERSATHTFRIKWLLNGGKEAISEPIVLTHFVPRTWSARQKTRREVGPPTDVSAEAPQVPISNVGCVEASILNAMALLAARQGFEDDTKRQSPPLGDRAANE
jgi:hypothetical protein